MKPISKLLPRLMATFLLWLPVGCNAQAAVDTVYLSDTFTATFPVPPRTNLTFNKQSACVLDPLRSRDWNFRPASEYATGDAQTSSVEIAYLSLVDDKPAPYPPLVLWCGYSTGSSSTIVELTYMVLPDPRPPSPPTSIRRAQNKFVLRNTKVTYHVNGRLAE